MTVPFSGAVLTGGASTRMGQDKAFLVVRGRPLVSIVVDALVAAGADDVCTIGGDVDRLARLGHPAVPDREPGEGPLGGLVQALHAARHEIVVVLACDQPNVGDLIGRLVDHLIPPYDAVVPVTDGVPQPLAASYSRRSAGVLDTAFRDGERSPRRVLGRLRWRPLDDVSPHSVVDLDDPGDVARYAASGRTDDTDEG
jgi:molybdopterin-guanine dinucleotide biosynthesis protein A